MCRWEGGKFVIVVVSVCIVDSVMAIYGDDVASQHAKPVTQILNCPFVG